MPKKTAIFVIILALVAAGLIYLAIRQVGTPPQQEPSGEEPSPTAPAMQTASLFFEVPETTASPGAQITQNILLDAGGQVVSGAQIYLQYDPSQITLNEISAPEDNFFGANPAEYIVLPSPPIDTENGIAQFTISNPLQVDTSQPITSKPLTGIDLVATVTFTPVAGFQGTTSITIVNNTTGENTSIVTSPDYPADNILLGATPLQVTVAQ